MVREETTEGDLWWGGASPLFEMDDTFVLQEFFVPRAACVPFVEAARPAFELAAKLEHIELLIAHAVLRAASGAA